MTANRIIPYGYKIESGINLPEPAESEIVRRIYNDYINGNSLLKIAQTLTSESVEFIPGRSDWNKNRVKRILEDERYLGNITYPSLIDADTHRQARAIKSINNNQPEKRELPFRLTCPVECECGGILLRRHDPRCKISEYWKCKNPECKRMIPIADSGLLEKITDLLNMLISAPDIITISDNNQELPLEIKRMQNEINHRLDGYDFDKDRLRADIFTLAAEKLRQTDTDNITSYILRARFEKQTPLSCFDNNLFIKSVSAIILADGGEVALRLKNNQTVRREKTDASDNDNARAC